MNKICIDPGHGGIDPGAINNYLKEKDITLKIALKTKNILEEYGFVTYVTRENDIYDSPKKKAIKSNKAKSDILISIHCNFSLDKEDGGIETISSGINNESERLAKIIQRNMVEFTARKDRGVKTRDDSILLNYADMPSIIIKSGFISNEREKMLLQYECFQYDIAKSILKSVCQYFDVEYRNENYEERIPNWKIDSEKWLRENRFLYEEHNPLEIIDIGTLGFILKRYFEGHNRM